MRNVSLATLAAYRRRRAGPDRRVAASDKLAIGTIALGAVVALAAASQWDMLAGWQPKLLILVIGGLAAARAVEKGRAQPWR